MSLPWENQSPPDHPTESDPASAWLGALGTAVTVARDPVAAGEVQRLIGEYVTFLSRMLSALESASQGRPAWGRLARAEGDPSARLSERELAIIRLLAGGHAVGSIARLMELSAYTVRNHLKACYRKLGVHSQIELVNYAFARGLVRTP